jgi:TrmH family RNA methyltransferase
MITSVHNSKVQWVHKLQREGKARRSEESFVVEGVRLTEEAWQAGWEARLVLYSKALNPRGIALVDTWRTRGAAVEEVSPHVMEAIAETETPQGLLVVLAMKSPPLPSQLDFVLLPDGVRDPGNLGTMLRTAAAAGAQLVLLPPGSTDPFAPKVVRAAMGAHFRLPVHTMEWEDIQALLKPALPGLPLTVYLADAKGETAYTEADFRLPTTLVIGGEAAGAGGQAEQLADYHIHIPMPGGMESLNAAVAAAVLMFEVLRQRIT